MKNLPDLKHIPAILKKEKVFKKAFHITELAAMPEQERDRYEHDLHIYWSYLSTIDKAATDARTEKASQIALNMKKDGVDLKLIVKYTGLTLAQIKRLK